MLETLLYGLLWGAGSVAGVLATLLVIVGVRAIALGIGDAIDAARAQRRRRRRQRERKENENI